MQNDESSGRPFGVTPIVWLVIIAMVLLTVLPNLLLLLL